MSEVLGRIAHEEQGQAELSWQIVAWCVQRGGREVREALLAERANLDSHRGAAAPRWLPVKAARLAALGLPGADLADRCVDEGLAEVRERLDGLLVPSGQSGVAVAQARSAMPLS